MASDGAKSGAVALQNKEVPASLAPAKIVEKAEVAAAQKERQAVLAKVMSMMDAKTRKSVVGMNSEVLEMLHRVPLADESIADRMVEEKVQTFSDAKARLERPVVGFNADVLRILERPSASIGRVYHNFASLSLSEIETFVKKSFRSQMIFLGNLRKTVANQNLPTSMFQWSASHSFTLPIPSQTDKVSPEDATTLQKLNQYFGMVAAMGYFSARSNFRTSYLWLVERGCMFAVKSRKARLLCHTCQNFTRVDRLAALCPHCYSAQCHPCARARKPLHPASSTATHKGGRTNKKQVRKPAIGSAKVAVAACGAVPVEDGIWSMSKIIENAGGICTVCLRAARTNVVCSACRLTHFCSAECMAHGQKHMSCLPFKRVMQNDQEFSDDSDDNYGDSDSSDSEGDDTEKVDDARDVKSKQVAHVASDLGSGCVCGRCLKRQVLKRRLKIKVNGSLPPAQDPHRGSGLGQVEKRRGCVFAVPDKNIAVETHKRLTYFTKPFRDFVTHTQGPGAAAFPPTAATAATNAFAHKAKPTVRIPLPRWTVLFRRYRPPPTKPTTSLTFTASTPPAKTPLPAVLSRATEAMDGLELDWEVRYKACTECGRRDLPTGKCSVCGDVRYCGTACQAKHWPLHRHACIDRSLFLFDCIC